MNAPNPNAGERDFDALRRAQRAHEPSMEEILASIRSIIADDREPAPRTTSAPKPAPAPAGPQIVYSKDAPAPRPVAETPRMETPRMETPRMESPARVEPTPAAIEPAAPAPKVVWRQPEAEALAAPEPAPDAEEEPLVSPRTNQAISNAFDALSASLALQGAELAENMTREILRPMLKNWLDENLPSLVERLVRAEIQRAARGGR
jgi:cell pole-organizing protein PopZ